MASKASPEIARMRAHAIARHKAATKKISRNKTAGGANIAGSQFDPRRDLSKVKNYNAKQLATYVSQLDSFVSRKTQFVPDSGYRPMPVSAWNRLKDAEKALNKINTANFNKVKNTKLPSGWTVEQKLSQTDPIHPHMHNPASNSAHREIDRRSRSIKSLQALEKLEMDLRKRATPKHQKFLEQQARLSVKKMLEIMGDDEMQNRISKLSSGKFNFMWNYSGKFAMDMSLQYEAFKKMMEEKSTLGTDESLGKAYRGYAKGRRDIPQLQEVSKKDATNFITWLEQQPEDKFK